MWKILPEPWFHEYPAQNSSLSVGNEGVRAESSLPRGFQPPPDRRPSRAPPAFGRTLSHAQSTISENNCLWTQCFIKRNNTSRRQFYSKCNYHVRLHTRIKCSFNWHVDIIYITAIKDKFEMWTWLILEACSTRAWGPKGLRKIEWMETYMESYMIWNG